MDGIIGCFAKPDCAAATLAAATVALVLVGIVQAIVLTMTGLAIRSSTRETAKQVRLTALPLLRVVFHRAPDKVFLHNASTASAASAASRARLQGFRFTWNDAPWQCTFEPTGMIVPGEETRLEVNIDQGPVEDGTGVPGNQVFTTAFSNALSIARPGMVLALHFEDMLGSCYRSEVHIDFVDLEFFLADVGHHEIRPKISKTTLVEDFPESLELVNRTA